MSRAEPLDPETVAALEAIDATLHGEPVDPELADLAELALILRDERPQPTDAFLARLDARAVAGFAPAGGGRGARSGAAGDARGASSAAAPGPPRRTPARGLWWGGGTALAGAVAIALLVVLGGHLGGGSSSASRSVSSAGVRSPSPRTSGAAATARTSTVSSSSSAAASSAAGAASSGGVGGASSSRGAASAGSAAGSGGAASAGGASGSGGAAGAGSAAGSAGASSATSPVAPTSAHGRSAKVPAAAPAPRSGRGRDITQSARLSLRARSGGIDRVAQQVFDVVGAEHGTVASSHVTARARGASSARFSLSVPSGRLQATLTRLSSLRGATVASRADASADITGDVDAAAARLVAARALHHSLLARLAAAVTDTEAAELQAALRRNEAAIVADSRADARLHARVTDSPIAVTVTAPPAAAVRHVHATSGFTVGRALHDAGDVLVVAAGVALIALAVLVPLGALVAIGAWVWALTLRRRREGALGS